MYAKTGKKASTFTFYFKNTLKTTSTFTFTWVLFCRTTFTFTFKKYSRILVLLLKYKRQVLLTTLKNSWLGHRTASHILASRAAEKNPLTPSPIEYGIEYK